MELRHLTTLVAIVESGSMARAAERLDAAPSTVTLRVHELEVELGVMLLTRQGRGVTLTDAGRTVYARARSVLAEIEEVHADLAAAGAGQRGQVRIGAVESAASGWLPAVLAQFCLDRPEVEVIVTVAGTRSIAAQVADGGLDIGLCAPPPGGNVSFEPLFHEYLAMLVPAGHPLADRPSLQVHDLGGVRLLLTEEGCAYRRQVEAMQERTGVRARSTLQLGTVQALVAGVAAGLGVALVPAHAAKQLPAGVLLRELTGLDLRVTIGMVTSGSLSLRHAARSMVELLRSMGAARGPAAGPPAGPQVTRAIRRVSVGR